MNDVNSLISGLMYFLSSAFLLMGLFASVPMVDGADFGVIDEQSFTQSYPPWESEASSSNNIDYSSNTLLHNGTETGKYVSQPFNGNATAIIPTNLDYQADVSGQASAQIKIQTSPSESFSSINQETEIEAEDGLNTEAVNLEAANYARLVVDLQNGAEIQTLDVSGSKFTQVTDSTNRIVELMYAVGLAFVVGLLALAFIIPFRAIAFKGANL